MEFSEKIARRYCQLIGIDPDEIVERGVGSVERVMSDLTLTGRGGKSETNSEVPNNTADVTLASPRWTWVAREIPSQIAWFTALSENLANVTVLPPVTKSMRDAAEKLLAELERGGR